MEILINEYNFNYGIWDKDLDNGFKPKKIKVDTKFINLKPNDVLLLLFFDYGNGGKNSEVLSGLVVNEFDIKYHQNENSLECIYIVCVDCCGVEEFEASATILFE